MPAVTRGECMYSSRAVGSAYVSKGAARFVWSWNIGIVMCFRLRLNPGTSDVLGPTFAGFTIDAHAKVVAMSLLDMTLKPVAP